MLLDSRLPFELYLTREKFIQRNAVISQKAGLILINTYQAIR